MKRLCAIVAALSIFSLYFVSCYYDNEEVLYPTIKCDTANITYKTRISLIMNNYCITCHNPSLQSGAISLTTYTDVVGYVSRITPAIKHTGPHPMPNNGSKLSDCSINQWDLWLSRGMPE